jgi:hypothetical protein
VTDSTHELEYARDEALKQAARWQSQVHSLDVHNNDKAGKLREMEQALKLQIGANRAQDERERIAANRLEMAHSCDWPDEVADRLLAIEQAYVTLSHEAVDRERDAFQRGLIAASTCLMRLAEGKSNHNRDVLKHGARAIIAMMEAGR